MVKDLNVPIQIVQCPIIREESGLALSSRNKYLSEQGKKDALVLSQILNNIKSCYKKGIKEVDALKETAYSFLTDKHDMEYLEIVDRETLEDKKIADENSIALIACRVENVRLIDNIYLGDD
jgi:pantoate--beta-alanine ligase